MNRPLAEAPMQSAAKRPQIVALSLATLILMVGGLAAVQTLQSFTGLIALFDRQEDVIHRMDDLLSLAKDVETARRGYLLTGDESYVTPMNLAQPKIYAILELLHADVDGGLIDRSDWDAAEAILLERIRLADESIERFRQDRVLDETQRKITNDSKIAMDKLRSVMQALRSASLDTHNALEHRLRSQEFNVLRIIVAVVAISILLMLFALAMLYREVVHRTRAEHTARIASDQLEATVNTLQRQNELIMRLGDLSHTLQAASSFSEALGILKEALPGIFWGARGALYLTRESRDHLELGLLWGDQFKVPNVMEPEDCWALRKGKLHAIKAGDRAFVCPHIQQETTGCAMCIPLLAQGETRGILHLDYRDTEAESGQREFAESCAEQIIVALTNLQLRDRLRTQAIRDPLTGLFNRRYMLETAAREIARARRSPAIPVAFVMLDIDHFKMFNDTFGHDAGDHVIQMVAEELKRFVRGADVAARYGGEEFVLLLPEASRDDAARRVETLRQRVAALQPAHAGMNLQGITLSMGVAAYPADGDSTEAVVKQADIALYEAKRQGRNRVIMASPAAVEPAPGPEPL